MTLNFAEIDKTIVLIETSITERRLRDAFIQLRHLAEIIGDWHITEEIDRLEEDYKRMLNYTVNCATDPEWHKVYDSIVSRMLTMTDRINHRVRKSQAPEQYYATLRFEAMQKGDTLQSLVDRYRVVASDLSFATMLSFTKDQKDRYRSLQLEADRLEQRIFNRVWIMYPFSDDTSNLLKSIFSNDSPFPDYFQRTIVSALLLGLVQFHDEQKLLLLLNLYQQQPDTPIGISALCAALIDMFLHRDRISTPRIINYVASLRDTSNWSNDVRTIFMQLLKSRDSERINREFTDNVLPELMKLKPEIPFRLNVTDMELGNLESNPEWEEILEKSGLGEKLRKAQEMLQDNGGMFLPSIPALKHDPFFNDIANWFTPYRASHPSLSGLNPSLHAICRMLEGTPTMCDSDKYSIAFLLQNMPTEQREMLRAQLDESMLTSMEMQASERSITQKSVEHMALNYLNSVYTFFNLYRRRGDFTNPFNQPLDLLSVDLLLPEFGDTEMLKIVAEFYFKRGYFDNAYNIFTSLEKRIGADCPTYQKMGYCRQKSGLYDEALHWYQKAEILDNKNIWTLRRMAACYSAAGQTQQSLQCLTRIADQRPNDLNVTLNIGHCYLELGQYSEALKNYFKVEYLDEKSDCALRPIAWCSLLTGNTSQALKYYDRILSDNPNATDHLNAGHAHLANGDTQLAIAQYKKAIAAHDNDIDRFINDFEADAPTLTKIGIDPSLPSMIVDALRYDLPSSL